MSLPIVSVVITNYNYEKYLEAAVQSVVAQTYPCVEIVIVDDCSTDGSRALIERICEDDPAIVEVFPERNGGQTVASSHGLRASSGAYVLFLDADDLLLPQAVEAHLYAHLSSRIPVAFSSTDIVTCVVGQDVNFSTEGFSRYVQSGKGRNDAALKPVDRMMPDSWFGQRAPVVGLDQLHFVSPPHVDPWVWSPSSANCYRRDAVMLLLRGADHEEVRWTDSYLVRPLSALFGSILIDRPLMRYQIHGLNDFTKGAPLQNLRMFDVAHVQRRVAQITQIAVHRLMSEVGPGGPNYLSSDVLFDAMEALCDAWDPSAEQMDFFADQIRANHGTLAAVFGEDAIARRIKSRKFKLWRRRYSPF